MIKSRDIIPKKGVKVLEAFIAGARASVSFTGEKSWLWHVKISPLFVCPRGNRKSSHRPTHFKGVNETFGCETLFYYSLLMTVVCTTLLATRANYYYTIFFIIKVNHNFFFISSICLFESFCKKLLMLKIKQFIFM